MAMNWIDPALQNRRGSLRTHTTFWGRRSWPAFALWLTWATLTAGAQTAQNGAPASEPPTGVIPLPATPPPTGLAAPLPPALRPLPRADRPLRVSLTLDQLRGHAPNTPINLQQAVALALGNSRPLGLATETLLQAQGRTSETRAAFNPTLGTGFTYTRLNTGQMATLAPGKSISIVNADQPVFTASVAMPIDIAGLLAAASSQAQFQEVAARIDVNRARNQIVLDTKNAFFSVLRAEALVTVAVQSLQNSLDRLSDAQKKLAAGTVARFDVIRAQTDVANAQQQLITARSNVSLSIANLNNTIGIDIDTPLQITATSAVENPPGVAPPAPMSLDAPAQNLPSVPLEQPGRGDASGAGMRDPAGATEGPDSLNLGPEYRAVVQEALNARPEILEAEANLAAARKGIQLARRSQLPSLAVSVGSNYSPNAAGFSPQTLSGSFVLSVSAPIFDGGISGARVTQARAQVAQSETNLRQSSDLVKLDVRSAYLTLVQARDRVAVANQALSEAQESFRLARVRYNNGVSALLEVSDAQAALTQAQQNQVNALYDYNNDRAALDKAAGRYAYVSQAPGYAAPPDAKTVGRTQEDARVMAGNGEQK